MFDVTRRRACRAPWFRKQRRGVTVLARPRLPRSRPLRRSARASVSTRLTRSGGMPRRRYGRCALLEQIPDLLTKFRAVLVMVNLHRVLNCNFEKFLVRVGRERHRAIHFAGILATIDEFPSHSILLGRMLLPRQSPNSVRFESHPASFPLSGQGESRCVWKRARRYWIGGDHRSTN